MKYQYIFYGMIPRLNIEGKPVLDPETHEPIVEKCPLVLGFSERGKGRATAILAYNDTGRPAARLFNTKQQFNGLLKRTRNYYMQTMGVLPVWLQDNNIEAIRILREDDVFEFNRTRQRTLRRRARKLAEEIAQKEINKIKEND